MDRRIPGHRRTALITGASSGIGRELARVFAANDFDLVITARRALRLNVLARELERRHGVRVTALGADLAEPGVPESLFEETEGQGVAIDVLVNNAGFGVFKEFGAASLADHLSVVQLNIVALTALTRLFLPSMIKRGEGRILNVASVAGFAPTPSAAVYGATKAYVLSLSEALGTELEGTGVTVTALCPGLTETEFSSVAAGRQGASAIPDLFKLDAAEVAREGFHAAMAGEPVRVNGLAYQLAVEMLRYQPRVVTRAVGRAFGRQLENGF